MFATAGAPAAWLPVTQSIPAITPEVAPLPLQSSTRTALSETPLATPYVEPPTVPATCVPWPLQSSALPPSIASKPELARPPNCWWLVRIPVSMMYAVTPAPVGVYVYVPLSGRLVWSMRSRPQVALLCVASSDTIVSRST